MQNQKGSSEFRPVAALSLQPGARGTRRKSAAARFGRAADAAWRIISSSRTASKCSNQSHPAAAAQIELSARRRTRTRAARLYEFLAATKPSDPIETKPMNLATTYLGFKLRTPLVPSASPLSENIDNIKRMEDAGASAIVFHSLFEEQVRRNHHELQFLSRAGHGSLTPRHSPISPSRRSSRSGPKHMSNTSPRRKRP